MAWFRVLKRLMSNRPLKAVLVPPGSVYACGPDHNRLIIVIDLD